MEAYLKIRDTSLYQAFRSEGFPARYDDNKISAFFNVHMFNMVFLFVAVGLSTMLILPGFRGKQRLFVTIRCITSLVIGLCIFFCNFELDWEKAFVSTRVPYKAGTGKQINATIGLFVGLRGINITLVGLPEQQIGETIKYNEHFSWEWDTGRPGFSANSGRFNREFRSSQMRGIPYPIQWIAEYFTFDGEGIRFGRHYRIAGWYTHIMMWLSIPLFLLANILFQMVIQYGALFLIMTGSSLITANILYSMIRNPIPLSIPFEGLTGETVFLTPAFHWCYYLNIINGLFCIFLGVVAFLSDLRYPDQTADFFGIDVLQSYEDYFAEVKINPQLNKKSKNSQLQEELSGIYAGLRKRNLSNRLSRIQKSWVRKKPMTQPRSFTESLNNAQNEPEYANSSGVETPLYENYNKFEPIGEESEENAL